MPFVSIIIPVYNVASFLPDCLDSVLNQTFSDFEVLCVDDGSTDKSIDILNQYAQKDSRIRILTQKNKGCSVARNNALAVAQGKYIAFLDSDDAYHPQFLSVLTRVAQEENVPLVWCDFQEIPQEQRGIKTENHSNLIRHIVYTDVFDSFIRAKLSAGVTVWNKLYRRDILDGIEFPTNINIMEDRIFCVKVMYHCQTAAYVPLSLIYIRQRMGSLTRSKITHKKVDDHLKCVELMSLFFENKPLKQKTRREIQKKGATICLKTCLHLAKQMDKSACLESWEKYRPILQSLREKGIYVPKRMSLFNRIKSFLFLNRYFRVLMFFAGKNEN